MQVTSAKLKIYGYYILTFFGNGTKINDIVYFNPTSPSKSDSRINYKMFYGDKHGSGDGQRSLKEADYKKIFSIAEAIDDYGSVTLTEAKKLCSNNGRSFEQEEFS